ncbi:MAG: hypothetical protein HDR00_13235 [Lachnospiraceae bacterium]|nr:hypothetical protein [Lachnospiraceae bacterium]
MKGKEKCKALKEIRRQIAEKNDIPYVVSQCKHQGDCLGTCPRCEAELRYLERELAIRQGLGKAAAVAGISMSVCASLTACASVTEGTAPVDSGYEDISGDVEIYEPDDLLPQTDTEETNPENEIEGKVEKINETEGMDETNNPEETEECNETEDPEVTTEIAGDISIEDMDALPAN